MRNSRPTQTQEFAAPGNRFKPLRSMPGTGLQSLVVQGCRKNPMPTTRTDHPGPLAIDPARRMAKTSGGVDASLLSQNGQNAESRSRGLTRNDDGWTAFVSATITQRPVKTSFRICDIGTSQ